MRHTPRVSLAPITDTELAAAIESLPLSPRLLADLAPRLQQAEVPVAEITDLLKRDAGLAARLISVANSAFYARAEPATSIEEAVTCLGFREVYRLVGAVAARQLSDEPLQAHRVDTQRFRENALFVALVMEELASFVGLDSRDAYTTGLLRSIGKVAMDRIALAKGETVLLPENEPLLGWEHSTWGCSNADVSARILSSWRFPAAAVEGVRHHYNPDVADLPMADLVNLAAGAADLRGYGHPGEESYWAFSPESFRRTGMDEGKLVWAGEQAYRTLQRVMGALG